MLSLASSIDFTPSTLSLSIKDKLIPKINNQESISRWGIEFCGKYRLFFLEANQNSQEWLKYYLILFKFIQQSYKMCNNTK